MKAAFNIKAFFILLFLTFLASVFNFNIANALDPSGSVARNNPECTGNAGGVITQPGTTNCEVTPDSQKITWYRVEFCTSKPTGPTPSTTIDRSSCSTFYQNDTGSEVSIVQGVGTQIGVAADYTVVPYGTYTYGIITLGSTFKFTTSVTFNGNISDGTNSTTTCVTKVSSLGTIYGYDGTRANTFAKKNLSCASGATAAEITVGVNTLTMDGSNDCNHLLTFQGTTANVAAYMLESDGTLVTGVGGTDTDQIKNGVTGCEAGVSNGVSLIQGIMALDLKITPDTTGIQIKYNNTRGISLTTGNSNVMNQFDSAFFDFDLSAL